MDFYKENKNKIEVEVDLASKDTLISDAHNLHQQLLKHYYDGLIHLLPDTFYNKSNLLNDKVNLLTKEEIKQKKSILNKAKIARKKIIEAIKTEGEIIELEKIEKIEITSQEISGAIALISVLFLSTGFVYNQIFLRYFGLELSSFFSISDYLNTSADKIFYSVLSAVFSVFVAVIFFPEYIRNEFPKSSPVRSRVLGTVVRWLPLLVAINVVFQYVSGNVKLFYLNLQMFVFITLFNVISRTLKYFKNPARTYIVMVAFLMFLTSISFKAFTDINHIVFDDLSKIKNYKIIFIPESNAEEENLVLLASNKDWFFFYNKVTMKTEIITAKEILKIECMKKNESFFYKFLFEHFQKENQGL